jgi:O-acetyl-ADP-ribose deacetylase (regulator of RNase III)
MITYVVSDLFKSPARVLVNTVNTVGVMGKGIAQDFKKIFPEMFKKYQILCEKKMIDIGKLWLYQTNHKWILNFPTKKHWRSPSKPEYIEAGLKKFVSSYADKGITSISFPMLGCGNGELDWEKDVHPLMEYYLNNLPIDIYIHLYRKDPFETEQRNIKKIKAWLRSEPESLAYVEVWADIQELLQNKDSFFTLDKSIGFTAKIIELPERGLQIKSESTIFNIYEEELVNLWQTIRSLGFCIKNSMPNELEKYIPYLVAIFKQLPYLKPVLISANYKEINGNFNGNSIGLQIIPGNLSNELSFLKELQGVQVHEQRPEA